MPLHIPDPLFRGVTPTGARRILKPLLQQYQSEIDTYLVPCAGLFTVPETLVVYGVEPGKIIASDITLFSSTLGYAADTARDVADLNFSAVSDELAALLADLSGDSQEEQAARILYSLKWAQLYVDKEFQNCQRTELERQRASIYGQYVETVGRFMERMSGMRYQARDAIEHVTEHSGMPRTFCWYNPPGYKNGYTKMFADKGLYTWAEPNIPELDPDRNAAFFESLVGVPALVAAFVTEGHATSDTPDGWHKAYVSLNEKTRKRSYVLTNRAASASVLEPTRRSVVPKNLFPIYDEHEITAESKIGMVPCTKEEALYYYDLFVRELGTVKAEIYYLFVVDGQVAGTCGFFRRDWALKRKSYLFETFGLSIPSARHARIGRLLMGALTCVQFRDEFLENYLQRSAPMTVLTHLRTVCLTKYPEAKKNRGLLKLIHRERMPNGRFYLVYETIFHKRNYGDVLVEWLEKHAAHTRPSNEE